MTYTTKKPAREGSAKELPAKKRPQSFVMRDQGRRHSHVTQITVECSRDGSTRIWVYPNRGGPYNSSGTFSTLADIESVAYAKAIWYSLAAEDNNATVDVEVPEELYNKLHDAHIRTS